MLEYLTLIFACQLAGELVVAATGLPVPGPVCGMALMFVGLIVKGGIPAHLEAIGDGLLRNLSLLFVPAGVGLMLNVGLLQREWLPIAAALVVSAGLTIAVTAFAMLWLGRLTGRAGPGAS